MGVSQFVADGGCRLQASFVEAGEQSVVAADIEQARARVFIRIVLPALERANRLQNAFDRRSRRSDCIRVRSLSDFLEGIQQFMVGGRELRIGQHPQAGLDGFMVEELLVLLDDPRSLDSELFPGSSSRRGWRIYRNFEKRRQFVTDAFFLENAIDRLNRGLTAAIPVSLEGKLNEIDANSSAEHKKCSMTGLSLRRAAT